MTQEPKATVQQLIHERDAHFSRRFVMFLYIWFAIAIASFIIIGAIVFHHHPVYLRDWHGLAIVLLALVALVTYRVGVARLIKDWPPPLLRSLIIWCLMYGSVLLLTMIDSSFAYLLYMVFGASFALFTGRYLIGVIMLIFFSLCAIQGFFAWPITLNALGSIFGEGVGLFAVTATSALAQYLTKERYERAMLLQQLTEANAALETAHRQLAESAAQEQELAVLRERTRLAREMHDTLGHALVLISVKLQAIQRLRTRDGERCEQEITLTQEIVRTTMSELRASIANLRSPALERESVERVLSRYAHEIGERAGWQVIDDIHAVDEPLPELVADTLWKIGQEALTNVEKHAQAGIVIVHMSRQNGTVLLRIQDDGIGMPADYPQRTDKRSIYTGTMGHYGLCGMAERAERLGGQFSLLPVSKHGTTVEVRLPLVEASHSTVSRSTL